MILHARRRFSPGCFHADSARARTSPGPGIRPALAAWMAGSLIWVFSGALSAAPVAAEDGESIEIPPPESPQEAAKDAFVLLTHNQQRVLGLGYNTGKKKEEDEEEFFDTDLLVQEEIEKAKRSTEITGILLDQAGTNAVSGFLREMQLTQKMLISMLDAESPSGGAPASELVLRFAEAERKATQMINVSWTERSAILQKYWGPLHEEGPVEIGRIEKPDDFDIDRPEMSYEEYQEKQGKYQDWLREQERQAANKRAAEQDRRRRAAERRRRQEEAGTPEAPRVGIRADAAEKKPEAPTPDPSMLKAMGQWQIGWSRKSENLKHALKQFLALDLERRNDHLLRTCQSLLQASSALGSDPISKTPEPELSRHLAAAMKAFETASDHCMYGRVDEAKADIDTARGALGQAISILRFYGLDF